jgi:tRNA U34 2-thiouridine synthase MnmA/TrmU
MKALILLSGGLDSTIAAELMRWENLELVAVNFKTVFCLCDRKTSSGGCRSHAHKVTDVLGIELKMVNATEDFLEVLKKPKHGYGANMNPCIDCRILFFRKSREIMNQTGASFIITGEVLGQRPMSQFRRQMELIEKESGLDGLVVRPLSAKLLPSTIPERMGWIRREQLLCIEGRSRKVQMALAKEFGINDYPCAAGGCLLTDPAFARKIKDLIKHDELNLSNIQLLKAGRYFRLSREANLIVGRDEEENALLAGLSKDGDYIFRPDSVNGPLAVARGILKSDLIELSCRIVARYCDRQGDNYAQICYSRYPDPQETSINASALSEDELEGLRV